MSDFVDKSSRQRAFKKALSGEESRRKREDGLIELRKKTREDALTKRRQRNRGQGFQVDHTNASNEPSTNSNSASVIRDLYEGIMGEDPNRQFDCTMQFRKLLSIERNPPIQEVISCGAVPRLIEFLKREQNTKLQFEAAWALTNIASGTSQHTRVVIDYQGVPIFVTLLRSPSDEVREQAVWALGNIAGDSPECRDLVLSSGGLDPLLSLCNVQSKLPMLRNATWTLSNLCRGKPQPAFQDVRAALPVLAGLLFIRDEEVLTDACWALSYLSDDTGPNNEKIQAVIESGCIARLVELLTTSKSNTVKTPALRTIGNIVTGDDIQTQVVIMAGALRALGALLENDKKGIRKEAAWTISNITAGNPDQIEAVMQQNLIPPLVQMLKSAEFDIRKEAAWAISNATSGGSDTQIRFLVRHGVIGPLCDLFTTPDSKIVMVALEGIENILRVGQADTNVNGQNTYADYVESAGGLMKLEKIQHGANQDVYQKTIELLTTYFHANEVEQDSEIAPQEEGGAFTFGGQPGAGGAAQGGFHF